MHRPGAVGLPLSLESSNRRGRTGVRYGRADRAREFEGVAQAEVEPLAGDRMQRLGGVADARGAG